MPHVRLRRAPFLLLDSERGREDNSFDYHSRRGPATPATVELRVSHTLWSRVRHQRTWRRRRRDLPDGCRTEVSFRTSSTNRTSFFPLPTHTHVYSVSVVSFSAANGSVLWLLSLSLQAVLPLLSYNGQSVISDGQTLDWLAPDGRSLSPPVTLYPIQGLLFDLTITESTSIVTMVYRCGFIATYTVGMCIV